MALKKYRRQVIRVRDANDELPEVILSTGDEAGRIIQLVITGGENYGTHCRFWLQKEEGLNVYQDMDQVTASYPTWEAAINTGGLEPGVYPCMFRIGDNDGSVTETFKTTARVLQGMLIDAEESEEMQSQLSEFEQRTENAIAANETATAAANDAAEAATAATEAIEHALDEVDVRVLTSGVLSVTNVDGVPTSYDVKQQVSDAINPKIEDADAATQAANDAATAANSAATSATDAAAAATSATSAATQATTAANSAASSATSAASDANAAVTSANNAAAAANTAAEDAEEAVADLHDVNDTVFRIPTMTETEGYFIYEQGAVESANSNFYKVSIPDDVSSLRIKSYFFGRACIVFTNEPEPTDFRTSSYKIFPTTKYVNPTQVDEVLSTDGYKYAYIPYLISDVYPFSCTYDALQAVIESDNNAVKKNGTQEVTKQNTTFYAEIDTPNLIDIEDGTYSNGNLVVTASNNSFVATKTADLTGNTYVKLGEIYLSAGTYTLNVFADKDYNVTYHAPFFVCLRYSDAFVDNSYAWVYSENGRPKTFTVTNGGLFNIEFGTLYKDNANLLLNTEGKLEFKAMFETGSVADAWINPFDNYEIPDITELKNEFNDYLMVCPSISMFESIGVIGDSYASGQEYLTGSPVNHYNLSWGQVLARMNGAYCTNYSRGGLTTKTWLADDRGLTKLLSKEPNDLYIVALGINDNTEISAERYSLGSSSDFDLANYASTPDTFYGNMCKIIGNIQTKAPKAKIVLSTMAADSTTTQKAINAAIVDCAELANIAYIKQYEDEFFKSNYYKNNMVSGHPIAPVYSGMAFAIGRLIAKCIKENTTYFNTYISNRTNDSAESFNEVLDIRTGTDGTVYSTAGNAVRAQINALWDAIHAL